MLPPWSSCSLSQTTCWNESYIILIPAEVRHTEWWVIVRNKHNDNRAERYFKWQMGMNEQHQTMICSMPKWLPFRGKLCSASLLLISFWHVRSLSVSSRSGYHSKCKLSPVFICACHRCFLAKNLNDLSTFACDIAQTETVQGQLDP